MEEMIPELSVVIPCYNEGESLYELFDTCRKCISPEIAMEYVIVNNGSTDNSESIFAELLSKPENAVFRLVHIDVNKGYGYGIMQGVYHAVGNIIGWTHADLQTDPGDVLKAYCKNKEALLLNKVLVKGRRKERSFFDSFFTIGMSVMTWLLLGERLTDINAQPKLFNHELLKSMRDTPNDFSLDTYVLYIAHTHGLKLIEYPVYFINRKFGKAKGGGTFIGKLKLIKRTLAFLWELRGNLRKGR